MKPLNQAQIALKRAVARAVHAAGGPRKLSESLRVDAPRLSRYGNLDDPNFAPVDVAFAVDAASGDHGILRAWAALAGFELVARLTPIEIAEGLARQAGALAQNAGELIGAAIDAAADGDISINEAKRIDGEASQVEQLAISIRETAQRAMA